MNDSDKLSTQLPRVIKLGGSLLDDPETPARLQHWLGGNAGTNNLWVTGGGRWADLIRDFDHLHAVAPTATHWAAITAMTLTANLLSGWFPDWPWLSSVEEVEDWRNSNRSANNVILSTDSILRQVDCDLPASWDVTSDSIAAWLAKRFSIPQLLLLKACDTNSNDPVKLANAEQVDPYLQTLDLATIHFRCVNLYDSTFDSNLSRDGL